MVDIGGGGILVNEMYTGDFRWGERNRGRYSVAKVVFICNNHPAIVSRETFDMVQKRLTERVNGGGFSSPRPDKFALTGLLRCQKCDSPMFG